MVSFQCAAAQILVSSPALHAGLESGFAPHFYHFHAGWDILFFLHTFSFLVGMVRFVPVGACKGRGFPGISQRMLFFFTIPPKIFPGSPRGRVGEKRGARCAPVGCGLVGAYFMLPPMMSSSSLVMLCWRVLLYCMVSSCIRSSALSVAACMASIRAACSEVTESSSMV